MSEIKKFEDLTKEQQEVIKKAGRKLVVKGLLIGANYGGLMALSNLCLIFANVAFFQSTLFLVATCVIVDFTLLRMMGSATRENAENFKNTVQQALDKK